MCVGGAGGGGGVQIQKLNVGNPFGIMSFCMLWPWYNVAVYFIIAFCFGTMTNEWSVRMFNFVFLVTIWNLLFFFNNEMKYYSAHFAEIGIGLNGQLALLNLSIISNDWNNIRAKRLSQNVILTWVCEAVFFKTWQQKYDPDISLWSRVFFKTQMSKKKKKK